MDCIIREAVPRRPERLDERRTRNKDLVSIAKPNHRIRNPSKKARITYQRPPKVGTNLRPERKIPTETPLGQEQSSALPESLSCLAAAAPARRRAEAGGCCGGVEQAALHPQLSRTQSPSELEKPTPKLPGTEMLRRCNRCAPVARATGQWSLN